MRDVNSVLERAGFENEDTVYDDRRVIVKEGHLVLKVESKCSTRKHLAPLRLEEVELQHEGQRLDAAGALYLALKKYKRPNPVTLSPPSIDTPGEETHLLVE